MSRDFFFRNDRVKHPNDVADGSDKLTIGSGGNLSLVVAGYSMGIYMVPANVKSGVIKSKSLF